MSDHIHNALEHVQEKIDEYREKTLEYYFEDGSHVIFEKYTIDTLGVIRNKKTGKMLGYGNGAYNRCGVVDGAGKQRLIFVARAVASTFLGKPSTLAHTVDHIESEQKKNDSLLNVRWLCKPGQRNNQTRQNMLKTALIIVKDGIEKTAKEWVVNENAMKKSDECKYTDDMISIYAKNKQHGFAYKEYHDLPCEVWKKIPWSENKKGHWEISDMNRMKYVTMSGVENVIEGNRLRLNEGYPVVGINRKKWKCHILAFTMFHETEWELKKPDEIVLHENDDKMDFRPHKLRLGTDSENQKDSHDNSKRDGTKTARMKCASYADGVKEREFKSQTDAAKYIYSLKISKSNVDGIKCKICLALSGNRHSTYGRTWKKLCFLT